MKSVLVTGAGGYLGDFVVRKYLAETDHNVVAVSSQAGTHWRDNGRVSWIRCDIAGDDLTQALAGKTLAQISHIVHAAAVTRFSVSRDIAGHINVEGSRKVWELATECRHLEMAAHISSIYATGLLNGSIDEAPVDEPQFANWYEWSKWQSEVEVIKNFSDLPIAVVRLGTLIADDETGRVIQYNAVHTALKLWFYGLLSIIPGHPAAVLHLSTCDKAAYVISELMAGEEPGVYNVSPTNTPMRLSEFVELCAAEFAADADYKRRGVLTPLLADEEVFANLRSGFHDTGSTVITSALDSLAPFAPQLYLQKEVVNTRLLQALGKAFELDMKPVVQSVCRWLVQSRWGKR